VARDSQAEESDELGFIWQFQDPWPESVDFDLLLDAAEQGICSGSSARTRHESVVERIGEQFSQRIAISATPVPQQQPLGFDAVR
jgi:hypothetical protein